MSDDANEEIGKAVDAAPVAADVLPPSSPGAKPRERRPKKGRQSAPPPPAPKKKEKRQRRTPQRDLLSGVVEGCTLWIGRNMVVYITIPIGEHFENWPVRSAMFKRWLAFRFFDQTKTVPGAQAIEDTIRVLEARGYMEGDTIDPWLRTGARAGAYYVDLCDPTWRAIKVTQHGWEIIPIGRLPFIRTPAMQALPEPQAGWSIDELRRFVNVETDEDFVLVVAWLVAALRASGPYPILTISGEQGSGKSSFARLNRSLVDPNIAPNRFLPKDVRDLVISASNQHVQSFDNISHITAELSDAFCSLATGGGFATRELHTNNEETIIQVTRPCIFNGITSYTSRPDLADRTINVQLVAISEESRRPEDEFWAEWDEVAPRVLGALCDGLSAAVRNLPNVRLARSPRLADFAKFITAAESGLGWEPGTFMAATTGTDT
jgi:hypothetical protein